MAKTVSLKLIEPIKGHGPDGGPLITMDEITFREPRYGDIVHLGEPTAYARSAEGMLFTSEKPEVVKSYLERLLVTADAIAAKQVVYDFFEEAHAKNSTRGQAS
jgi:hypothetical protein